MGNKTRAIVFSALCCVYAGACDQPQRGDADVTGQAHALTHPAWDSYCAEAYDFTNFQGAQYQLPIGLREPLPAALVGKISSMAIAPDCVINLYVDSSSNQSYQLSTWGDSDPAYDRNIGSGGASAFQYTCLCNSDATIVAWAREHVGGSESAGSNSLPLFADHGLDLEDGRFPGWSERISEFRFHDIAFGAVRYLDAETGEVGISIPEMAGGDVNHTLTTESGIGYNRQSLPETASVFVNWNDRIDALVAHATESHYADSFELSLATTHGTFANASGDGGGTVDQAAVGTPGEHQKFMMRTKAHTKEWSSHCATTWDGEVVFIQAGNGHYWSCQSSGGLDVNRLNALAWEEFELINHTHPDGCLEDGDDISLRSTAHNKYVNAAGLSSAMVCDRTVIGAGETFTVRLQNHFHEVYSADFDSGTSQGWFVAGTSTSSPVDSASTCSDEWSGAMLGGYGLFGKDSETELRLFSLPAHDHLMVAFDFVPIDSWDNEEVILSIDGNEVLRQDSHVNDDHYENACGGPWADGPPVHLYTQIEHTGSTATISIKNTLNQGFTDESMGIDNVTVSIRGAAPVSCQGSCGGNAGGCWCDAACQNFQDCCPDRWAVCP